MLRNAEEKRKFCCQSSDNNQETVTNETSCLTNYMGKVKRIDEHVKFPFLCSSSSTSYIRFLLLVVLSQGRHKAR
jgi:hypothetical protein